MAERQYVDPTDPANPQTDIWRSRWEEYIEKATRRDRDWFARKRNFAAACYYFCIGSSLVLSLLAAGLAVAGIGANPDGKLVLAVLPLLSSFVGSLIGHGLGGGSARPLAAGPDRVDAGFAWCEGGSVHSPAWASTRRRHQAGLCSGC